ncbi:MAG: class I SAM-dependent methyltransferase, partial [Myxococcaceae bacterium]
MTQISPREVRRRFSGLPLAERFHVWARLLSAPLQPIVDAVPQGRFLDLGCGHGVLSAWVAVSRPDVRVVAIDPDARKTHWAAMALQGLSNVDVRTGDAASLLPEFGNGFANGFAKGFDGVVLADVLYLLPP